MRACQLKQFNLGLTQLPLVKRLGKRSSMQRSLHMFFSFETWRASGMDKTVTGS